MRPRDVLRLLALALGVCAFIMAMVALHRIDELRANYDLEWEETDGR